MAAVVREARTYAELVAALVARRHELGLSQIELDGLAGWADGYAGKVEAFTAPRNGRTLGALGLERVLGALGVKLVVVEDPEAPLRGRLRRLTWPELLERPRAPAAPCLAEARSKVTAAPLRPRLENVRQPRARRKGERASASA